MPAVPHSHPTVLSTEELELFRRNGYVRVEEAFAPELALEMQGEIWREIEEDHGVRPDDPGTWKTLPHSPRRAKTLPLNQRLASERFTGAIGDLLGYEDWKRPASWGGFLVNFPEPAGAPPWDVPTEIWHWDGPPGGKGLLIFSHFGEVLRGGGGTLILSGSHRLVRSYYDSLPPEELAARSHKHHRKAFHRFDPWIEGLVGRAKEPVSNRVEAFMNEEVEVRGIPCRVVELTGMPGDAVYCDLGMLHCASRNCREVPRFMRTKFLFLD